MLKYLRSIFSSLSKKKTGGYYIVFFNSVEDELAKIANIVELMSENSLDMISLYSDPLVLLIEADLAIQEIYSLLHDKLKYVGDNLVVFKFSQYAFRSDKLLPWFQKLNEKQPKKITLDSNWFKQSQK